MQQTVEYWWDAINTHKISPRGMPAYDRNEANAIFMAGDAAFTVADSLWLGHLQRSPPSRRSPARWRPPASRSVRTAPSRFAWDDIWWLGDPEVDRAGAHEGRQADAGSDDARRGRPDKLFKATGAPPPNTQFWPKIAAADPFMALLKESVLDSPDKVRGAYLLPRNGPPCTRRSTTPVTKAVTGRKR